MFEILWTEDSETHIARHGITPGEVEDAIYSPTPMGRPGPVGYEAGVCADQRRALSGSWLV